MTVSTELDLDGHAGHLAGRRWEGADPARYVALLCHGYGEHIGRYEHVAARLVADGAVVYGVDHVGHGHSDGERVLLADFEAVGDDFRLLEQTAREEHPGLPVVLIGHSMGGTIAGRYAQRFGEGLAALVLSAPVLGSWSPLEAMLAMPELPDVPLDPDGLSRDPAVGQAYVADPLVWHGGFKRPTLEALGAAIGSIAAGKVPQQLPVLWLHGTDDPIVSYTETTEGWRAYAPLEAETHAYPEARHEVFNETNRDEVIDDMLSFINAQLPDEARRHD